MDLQNEALPAEVELLASVVHGASVLNCIMAVVDEGYSMSVISLLKGSRVCFLAPHYEMTWQREPHCPGENPMKLNGIVGVLIPFPQDTTFPEQIYVFHKRSS